MRISLLLILFCFAASISRSENDSLYLGSKYGGVVNLNYNLHSVDLRNLPSVPDSVPHFAVGNNLGFTIGAFYEYRFTQRSSILLRGLYSYHPANISGKTPKSLLLNGSDTLGSIRHNLSADLSNVKIEPLYCYRLFGEFSFLGGLNIGTRFEKTFSHDEEVVSPEGAVFENGSPKRSGTDEVIKSDLGLQTGIITGLRYDIPLNFNGKWLLGLEMIYETGFSDIASDLTWDANAFRVGFSIKYSDLPTVPPIVEKTHNIEKYIDTLKFEREELAEDYLKPGKTIITIDTTKDGYDLIIDERIYRTDTLYVAVKKPEPKVEKPQINKKCFKMFVYGADGKTEYPSFKLEVEEFRSTTSMPLLNFAFFDSASAQIPPRYNLLDKSRAEQFEIKDLANKSALEAYRNIFNVVGLRLRENPKANIKLIGCNDGLEEKNLGLSRQRAGNVKDYLVEVWGVASDRISLEARVLPREPSNNETKFGRAENRRVEFQSDVSDILKPIIIDAYSKTVSPSQIRIYANAADCYETSEWSLSAMQEEQRLIKFSGSEQPPKRIIWRAEEKQETVPKKSAPLLFKYKIKTSDGDSANFTSEEIPVKITTVREKQRRKRGDKKVDKYSLILFGFDNAKITADNREIVEYINGKISPKSTVAVIGYADITGNDEYNYRLSLQRAKNAADLIKQAREVKYEGLGESYLLYDNSTPEGRFYCRTVRITVETPLDE